METWPRLGLLQRDGSVRHCVHTAWGFPQEGATAGRRPSPHVLLLNRCLQGGRRNPKLSSTATVGGAEHGIPSYFSDSGKQQRLHSGKGPWQHSPSSRLLTGRDGARELGTGLAAPREAAQGVCQLWWERSTAAGGESGAVSGKRWRSQERHVPSSYQDKCRTNSTLPHAPTPETKKSSGKGTVSPENTVSLSDPHLSEHLLGMVS